MKTIKFYPKHRINETEFVPSFALEKEYPGISTWEYLEEKTFDDDLEIVINRKYASYKIPLWQALLDGKPEFKLYNKKEKKFFNPNFRCIQCKTECVTEYKLHVDGATLIPLWIDDERYCLECFEQIPNLHISPSGEASIKGNEK